MADQSAGTAEGTTGGMAAPGAPRVRISGVQRTLNVVMRGLLRTPLVSAAIGARLVTLYVVGRKSGARYTIVVAYTRHDGDLLIGTPFKWMRNLRTGEPLELRLKGRLRQADVTAYSSEAEVTRAYEIMCRQNHTFAGFNKVRLDAAGNPDPEDLHLAWLAGARAARLRIRA
jgi:hypothetical protein